jgi:hypothetical protein
MPAPIIRPKVIIETLEGGQTEVNLMTISPAMAQSILKLSLQRNNRGPRLI